MTEQKYKLVKTGPSIFDILRSRSRFRQPQPTETIETVEPLGQPLQPLKRLNFPQQPLAQLRAQVEPRINGIGDRFEQRLQKLLVDLTD